MNANAMHANLGRQGKDKITGFTGVAYSFMVYMSGCAQFFLQPPKDKDGKLPSGEWFDAQRIDFGAKRITLNNDVTPGAGPAYRAPTMPKPR